MSAAPSKNVPSKNKRVQERSDSAPPVHPASEASAELFPSGEPPEHPSVALPAVDVVKAFSTNSAHVCSHHVCSHDVTASPDVPDVSASNGQIEWETRAPQEKSLSHAPQTAKAKPQTAPSSAPSASELENAIALLAKVAHEVRTPLAAIAGFAELLKAEKLGPLGHGKYREYAELIASGAAYALTLLDDLLDPDKVRSGGFFFEQEKVDLAEVIGRSIELLQPLAAQRDLTLKTRIEPKGVQVLANARALQQILFNLLSNAIKVSRPGSVIAVVVQRSQSGAVRLGVQDTGDGDETDLRARSQLPLKSEDGSSGFKDGHGLGLPLTRHMAELLGADLQIGKADPKGTTVEILFPQDIVVA